MPLARYFAYIGSVLLALLFIADACLPKLPEAATTNRSAPLVRIHSEQKWPERVVYDTSAPIIGTLRSENLDPGSLPPMMADASPKLREAFAEQRTTDAKPTPNAKRPDAGRQRRHKLARMHIESPVRLVARRSPFTWFGPAIW